MADGLASGAGPDPSDNHTLLFGESGKERPFQDTRVLGSTWPAQEALEDKLNRLLETVARQHALSMPELCSGSKRAIVIKARHALARALRIKPPAVYRAIAKATGDLEKEVAMIDQDMA